MDCSRIPQIPHAVSPTLSFDRGPFLRVTRMPTGFGAVNYRQAFRNPRI
jgi:hypothetical protein